MSQKFNAYTRLVSHNLNALWSFIVQEEHQQQQQQQRINTDLGDIKLPQ